MKKSLNFNRLKLPALFYFALFISLLFFTSACGDADYSFSETTETGSISFSVKWQGAPTIKDASDSVLTRVLDCNASGVETVEGKIYDENNNYLAGGGPWNCEAHAGTIENVPEGSNRKAEILGKNTSGDIIYQGEQTGIEVIAGQTTDAGEITVSLAIPTNVSAIAGNGEIILSWDSVPGAISYNIYWDAMPGVDSTTFYSISVNSNNYIHSGLINGDPNYYVITAVFYSGESSESREVWATPSATGTNPSAPINVSAIAGDGQITISWDSVSGATSYNIYWSTSSGVTKDTGTKISNVTSQYTHASLTNDTTYYYVVTAENSYGESGESSEVSATPNASSLSNGLIAYYPFNGNANDESGNGNNGTVNGAILTTDRNGNPNSAYYFNDGYYIEVSGDDSLKLTNEITISTWIIFDGGYYNPRIIEYGPDTFNGYALCTIGTSNQRLIEFFFGGIRILTTTYLESNTWYHVVSTGTLSKMKIYINGVLYVESDVSPSGFNYIGNLNIGRKPISAYDYWGGKIDDIRIYNRALSEAEIQALYNLRKLPDTGQTQSFTSTFGEDSDYTINPPSYTDNGDGTVTDNVTGLIWQKEDDDITRIWDDANSYCNDLSLASYSDWRLPSKKELIRIVDYGIYNPAIDVTYFPGTDAAYYWSSTTYAYNTSDAWGARFDHGFVYSSNNKSDSNYVRCVRGQELSFATFTDNGDETVTNNSTGLMWQKGEGGQKTWENAISYCENLSLAGHTDWRLPNVKELDSITDNTLYNPAIDTNFFPYINASSYWTSTTHAYYTSDAWRVNFSNGGPFSDLKSQNYYVRCVRGGQ